MAAQQLLDVWHGAEHLAEGAKKVFGSASVETATQAAYGRQRLLEDGYAGVMEWVDALGAQAPAGGDGASGGGVLNDFCGHQDRLKCALHMRRGQSIGSGLGEGTIRQLLNKPIKQTGARWRVEHMGPLVERAALAAGPEWQDFWNRN